MCIMEMCDAHYGNQHSVNYATNEIALYEHQKTQSAQPIELKYTVLFLCISRTK